MTNNTAFEPKNSYAVFIFKLSLFIENPYQIIKNFY